MAGFQVRTDLAVEAREHLEEDAKEASGVRFREWEAGEHIRVSQVLVESEQGAAQIGKPVGTYLTLEAANLWRNDGGSHREISRVLAEQIHALLGRTVEKPVGEAPRVLVVGLGNAAVTSDSLGPKVCGNLAVTRNLLPEGRVSSIAPGVMAQTGMEAAEVIRGIVRETEPEAVLVVDALAARSVSRLGNTIQLSDAGIHPGSGVGNHRDGLTRESLGIPVIALGAPTVVRAAAIVCDTVEALGEVLAGRPETEPVSRILEEMTDAEKYQFIRELLEPRFGPLFVTPKDVDDTIERLSFTISEGINIALHGEA
ncbi:MAG: GPR endopeptidase [Lachnospiraceae bacterium]|nr:GPR endopeptidase [Lachnospiraceae bacterium]